MMEKHIELQDFGGDMLRNRRDKDSISDVKGQEFDRDRYELARVGKEQVLKVCTHPAMGRHKLTVTAPIWPGVYDRTFLWIDVHMGKFTCVSPASNLDSASLTLN